MQINDSTNVQVLRSITRISPCEMWAHNCAGFFSRFFLLDLSTWSANNGTIPTTTNSSRNLLIHLQSHHVSHIKSIRVGGVLSNHPTQDQIRSAVLITHKNIIKKSYYTLLPAWLIIILGALHVEHYGFLIRKLNNNNKQNISPNEASCDWRNLSPAHNVGPAGWLISSECPLFGLWSR